MLAIIGNRTVFRDVKNPYPLVDFKRYRYEKYGTIQLRN